MYVQGKASMIRPEDIERIIGQGANDRDGRGNVNVGDGGVAFVLASAGAVPGGMETVRVCV